MRKLTKQANIHWTWVRSHLIAAALVAGAAIAGTGALWSSDHAGVGSAYATARGANGPIAFRRFFDAGHRTGAIFLTNTDGTGERQITHPPSGAVDAQFGPPSFSPDGSKLVFTR